MDPAAESHRRQRAALSAVLDGEEPSLPISELFDHLSWCTDCSAWLDRVRQVDAGLRSLPVIQPSIGEGAVNAVDVKLCACSSGGACLCRDCQCGPLCTCHDH